MAAPIRNVIEVIEHNKQGVCKILREDGKSGSGFRISSGEIITAEHVIGEHNNVLVKYNGNEYECEVINQNRNIDLAVLNAIDIPEGLLPLELDGTNSITQGEEVLIMGYPLGSDNFTVHRGFLSARGLANEFPFGRLPQHEENCPLLQIDGTINEGFSGGPIVRISSNTIAGFVTSKYGLLQDFVRLRTDVDQHLRSPLFQQIREGGGGGIGIGGINFGAFALYLIQSLSVLSQSLQLMHVGIGYGVNASAILAR